MTLHQQARTVSERRIRSLTFCLDQVLSARNSDRVPHYINEIVGEHRRQRQIESVINRKRG